MSQILATRDLCARALDAGQPNPWILDGDAAEQDFHFFAPLPAPGATVFTRSTSESPRDGDAGSLLTQILDQHGRLLAEGWTNAAAAVHPNLQAPTTVLARAVESVDEVRGADLLAAHVAAAHGSESLRRFRVRIAVPLAGTARAACSERELQRYTRDGENLADVALTCELPDGTVIARAWATCVV
ncbi:hypothetical protein [Tomitella biformata]|uniref:hypothetical protein n=1 Tax=Tomitella biformata TaxID=630403 RepID=UPI000465DAB5|nr:hypothetical protein [Tomitella biformata]